jgi:hypothetical protein
VFSRWETHRHTHTCVYSACGKARAIKGSRLYNMVTLYLSRIASRRVYRVLAPITAGWADPHGRGNAQALTPKVHAATMAKEYTRMALWRGVWGHNQSDVAYIVFAVKECSNS